MSLATIVAAPIALATAFYGGRFLLRTTLKKPAVGLAVAAASITGYYAMPADLKAEIGYQAQEIAAAPAQVTDLFGDLVDIVEEGNSDMADASAYADENLTDLYTHETDRYGTTYQRIMDRILLTVGGDAVVMEDTGYEEDGYNPYPGGV